MAIGAKRARNFTIPTGVFAIFKMADGSVFCQETNAWFSSSLQFFRDQTSLPNHACMNAIFDSEKMWRRRNQECATWQNALPSCHRPSIWISSETLGMRITTRSQFSALWSTHDDSLVLYEPILRPNTVEFCAITRTVGAKKQKLFSRYRKESSSPRGL